MVYKRSEVVQRALAVNGGANTPGMCQAWTRSIIGVNAVGDVDGDGDADAIDGWLSEPIKYRHFDRNPPAGVPGAWSGGRSGFGHRAVSVGNGRFASTDAGGRGVIGVRSIEWFEINWGMTWLGWSDTMSGELIPVNAKPKFSRFDTISWNVNRNNVINNVRASLTEMVDRHSPDLFYLYEAGHFAKNLDGLGYHVHGSVNNDVVVLVRNDLIVVKSRIARMKEAWIGPLMGRAKAPRAYRIVKVKKRGRVWKTVGVHFPFGNKARSESVRWVRRALNSVTLNRPVITFGDYNFNKVNVIANIGNKVNGKVVGSGIDLAVYKNCELVKEIELSKYGSDHAAMYYRFRKRM